MRPEIWAQLKNLTSTGLVSALEKDDWARRSGAGSAVVFKKQDKKVVIREHSHKTYGHRQLTELLKDIGWTERDLKRLKLIK